MDFEPGLPGDIALHLNPRLKDKAFVRNSRKSGTWGTEDREGPWLFSPGVEFNLYIECQVEGFKVVLNGVPIPYFKHRLDPKGITDVKVSGDVVISNMKYETSNARQLKNNRFYRDFVKEGKSTPFVLPFWSNFLPGAVLIIVGMPQVEDPNRFAIDFEWGLPRDIALHLNPRLKDKVFVRNSRKSGAWGAEDRDGPLLFTPGKEFKLQIECQQEGFRITLNGAPITFFTHRLNPEGITNLRVSGDVIIKHVTCATPNVRQLKNHEFFKEFDMEGMCAPYVLPLLNNFPPDSILTLEGMPSPDDPNRFDINFESGQPEEITWLSETGPPAPGWLFMLAP